MDMVKRTLQNQKLPPPRPVVLPDGEYDAYLIGWRVTNDHHETQKKDAKKLELHWKLIQEGVVVRQFLAVHETKRGLSNGWQSNLHKSYASLFGWAETDVIDPDEFGGFPIKLKTRTSGKDKLKYSVVESLIGRISGENDCGF